MLFRSDSKVGQAISIKKQIVFALSVSLLNPHAIVDIVGVIGTSALKYNGEALILFTATCIVVSWIWFFGLMFVGSSMKQVNNRKKVMTIFNKCSALFIFATAVYLFIGLFNM